jgi:hypothetical protein
MDERPPRTSLGRKGSVGRRGEGVHADVPVEAAKHAALAIHHHPADVIVNIGDPLHAEIARSNGEERRAALGAVLRHRHPDLP